MKKKINVLFTSSGRRVSLIRKFKESINLLNLKSQIHLADNSSLAPTAHVGETFHEVPLITDKNYLSLIREICIQENIKIIIPLIDNELDLFSKNIAFFHESDIFPIVSSNKANLIFSSKEKTYEYFKENKIPCPNTYQTNEAFKLKESSYPLIIKPIFGSSSSGVNKLINKKDLEYFSKIQPNSIIQEFIEGDEFTIDVFFDLKGKLKCVVPRKRIETRSGEVSKSVTIKENFLIEEVYRLFNKDKFFFGCITIQCIKENSKSFKFIEINPRFGGGYPLTYKAGANFPLWILQEVFNSESDATQDCWQDNLLMLRYDEEIFKKLNV